MNAGEVLSGALATLWGLEAFWLRRRARRLHVAAPSDAPVSGNHVFVTRPGVRLDESARRAASAHARRAGVEVLDLVSPRLASWRAMSLLLAVDPLRLRCSRLARGVSAGDAILVDASLLARSGGRPEAQDAIALNELTQLLKRYSPAGTDLAIVPGLESPSVSLRERRRLLRLLFGDLVGSVLALQFLMVALAIALAPAWGLGAFAVWHLQIFVVTLGTPLAPSGRLAHTAARTAIDAASAFGPAARPPAQRAAVELRPLYDALLARGIAAFFEPRRDDCPLCGDRRLSRVNDFGDRFQLKPGRFVLARCARCGHIFQNPRLSLEGLSFYYRDFYDGLGDELAAGMFAMPSKSYRERAQMVVAAAGATPRRWLDVGAGHGHFCCLARELLPGTRFDGLDLSESVDEGVRRRWLDRAIRGLFPEVAPGLAEAGERYDVVSMSHYLEHTRDPRAEIDAAARVLRKGGLLLVEVPDPESRLGRLLGRGWLPWFQPQHQHLLSARNLERLLLERGFEPLDWRRGQAHQPNDFTFLALLSVHCAVPFVDFPWRPPAGRAMRAWRAIAWSAAPPLIGAAWLLDHALAPLLRREGWANTYRVLARRVA